MTSIVMIKRMAEIDKYKYYCKCGHTVVIYPIERKNRKICNWCGQYVYISRQEEFKEKLGGMIK